ncbi:unnamed protein product [Adineta ricciae]|uniref:Uncharacterized protein n=1 Tax=Adineta ricciae TaxID=249248 RepID=A0A815N0J5_ADIRI|nr:unnamed protein product [Adineta ricciae]
MSILLAYNGLHVEQVQVEVKNPSLETYRKLIMKYSDSVVECPCSQISSLYESFIQLTPTYHSICSSSFISQQWIEALFDALSTMRYFLDFRTTGSLEFQSIREICSLSQSTFNSYIEVFYNEEFIAGYLVHENVFEAQIATIVDSFRLDTISKFAFSFSLSQLIMHSNLLVSCIQANYIYVYYTVDKINWGVAVGDVFVPLANGIKCYCNSASTDCPQAQGFYDLQLPVSVLVWPTYTPTRILENWSSGCYAMDQILSTSIERTFLSNQTALDIFVSYFNNSSLSNMKRPIALNKSNVINQNSTFNEVVQSTMLLKDLRIEVNYSLYFADCRPKSCLYTIQQHYSFLYMFTTLFGLYGGLSVALRLIIPLVVGFLVRRVFRKSPTIPSTSVDTVMVRTKMWKKQTREMAMQTWILLNDLNLFKSSPRQHGSDIRQQRWMTRIYFLIFGLFISILMIYMMADVEIKSVEVKYPSMTTVEQLEFESINGLISSLQCSCTKFIVPYGSFIQVQQPVYHQVCSSALVTPSWQNTLSGSSAGKKVFCYAG